jgi:AdoMet-dependent heme synthase
MDAAKKRDRTELTTDQGKMLIDQIAEVGKPILVLSGGEPLLREDIFKLAKYGVKKGLRMTMGTNGTLINDHIAKKIASSGICTVAVSIDSSSPKVHDEFRGVNGSWKRAIKGIEACIRNGVNVQFNITITRQNYDDVENIFSLAENYNIRDAHLFFLVSTGRGKELNDVSPEMYEGMLHFIFKWNRDNSLKVKPTCAPQFMRIAKQLGVDASRWSRGCIAGISYCRIYPDGSVTPCPYLPIKVGNVKDNSFKEIWFGSKTLNALRNYEENLQGKCRVCEYSTICGGCRARAVGLSDTDVNLGGTLHEPRDLNSDLFAEDPWCKYMPNATNSHTGGCEA